MHTENGENVDNDNPDGTNLLRENSDLYVFKFVNIWPVQIKNDPVVAIRVEIKLIFGEFGGKKLIV